MENKNSKATIKLLTVDREIKKRHLQETLQRIKNEIFEENVRHKEEIGNLTERKKKIMAELRTLSSRKITKTA